MYNRADLKLTDTITLLRHFDEYEMYVFVVEIRQVFTGRGLVAFDCIKREVNRK